MAAAATLATQYFSYKLKDPYIGAGYGSPKVCANLGVKIYIGDFHVCESDGATNP